MDFFFVVISLVVKKAWKKEVQDLLLHVLKLEVRAVVPEWVVLWPNSLIACIYDTVSAVGPVAEVDYVGNKKRKGVPLSLFSFLPSIKSLKQTLGKYLDTWDWMNNIL